MVFVRLTRRVGGGGCHLDKDLDHRHARPCGREEQAIIKLGAPSGWAEDKVANR